MKGKIFIVFFFLISLLMVLLSCGRKGPPTLPKKPSSLVRIEQKAQLPGDHLGNSLLSSLSFLGLPALWSKPFISQDKALKNILSSTCSIVITCFTPQGER